MIDALTMHIVDLIRKHGGLSASIRRITLHKFVLVALATLPTWGNVAYAGATTAHAKGASAGED